MRTAEVSEDVVRGPRVLSLEPLEPRLLLSGGQVSAAGIDVTPTLIHHWEAGTAEVWAYDTSGPVDIDPAAIQVKFGANNSVSSITLTGTQAMDGLGIVAKGSAIGSVKDSRTGTRGPLAFLALFGPVKSIQLGGGVIGINLNGARLDIGTMPPDFDADGSTADSSALLVGPTQTIKLAGSVSGDVLLMGETYGVSLKSFSAASMDGDLVAQANVGKVALAGTYGGEIRIGGSLSGLQIKGGDLAGSVLVAGTAGKLAVTGVNGTGGSVMPMAHIKAGVSLSGLTVSGSLIGGAGSEADMVQICAPTIGSISVRGNVTNARILAGADLGNDWAIGGVSSNADTFHAGTINKIAVTGDVQNSLIGAGVQVHDGVFDLQWLHDNTAFIAGSIIKSGSIGGSFISSWADAGEPYGIGAATLGKGKIGGGGIDLVFSNEEPLAP